MLDPTIYRILAACLVLGLLSAVPVGAAEGQGRTEKVAIQLKWLHSFQFAGYYAAKEKGYYAAEGLDVALLERALRTDVTSEVLAGHAQYGVHDAGLVLERVNGKPVVVVASIFQHSPIAFISLKKSGIVSPYEMIGKRVMMDKTSDASLIAMFAEAGIKPSQYQTVPHNFNYDDLANGKVDVSSAYVTNEPYLLAQKDIEVSIINPLNYGVDFPGDLLFTSENEVRQHPERVEKMRRATIRGWDYALKHPDEISRLILEKYNSRVSRQTQGRLQYAARETYKLILPDVIPLGSVDGRRFQKVLSDYQRQGLAKPGSSIEGFFYGTQTPVTLNLTEEEKAWLKSHPILRVGIDRDFAPYEWVDKEGRYQGMAADMLAAVTHRLGVKTEIIKNRPWHDILQMAKKEELDMIACAVRSEDRENYLRFTSPFTHTPVAIISAEGTGYLGDLQRLSNKPVSVVKGYFMEETLRREHPSIQLLPAESVLEALNLVLGGAAVAYVGDAASANHVIISNNLNGLKLAGMTSFFSDHSMAAIQSEPVLAGLLQKALDSIPAAEKNAIADRWFGLKTAPGVSYKTVAAYAAGGLGVLLLVVYWNLRLRREIALRQQSEQRLRGMYELSPLGIALTDMNGRFIEFNESFLKITGYPTDELNNLDYWKLTPRKYEAAETEQLKSLAATGRYGPYEKEYVRKDGQLVPVQLNGMIVKGADGKEYIWSMVEDITERKATEAATLLAKERAEALAQYKSEFLANMSHEIRTPMNAIIGLSQLALNKEVSDEVRDYLVKINTSSESLLGILNDILDFSKMEASKLGIEHTRFDLDQVLGNLYNMFSVHAEEKGLEFSMETDPAVPNALVGDALRIQQVISNLLGNAIKFTERGMIEVRVGLLELEKSQVRIRFSVLDTGIGISQEDQAKLFQPFSQVDTSITRRFGGTGLGLAISHKLLQLMGSNFHVEGSPGNGTTFSFDLLLGVAARELNHEPSRNYGTRRTGALSNETRVRAEQLKGARILVAEDNVINQQVVKEFLQLAGAIVDIANNGKEVLQLLEKNPYDAVLMDVHMPVMGGVEATEHIRLQERFSQLPVIALTAGVTQEERDRCHACGMNDFVPKPVNPQELIDALCHRIGKTAGTHAAGMGETGNDPLDSSLNKLPGFDLSNLMALVGGNVELVAELLHTFQEDAATAAANIEAQLGENNLEAAWKLVHTVKGSAGNMGASKLHAAAAALEASLKRGELDPSDYANFQQAMLETREVLNGADIVK